MTRTGFRRGAMLAALVCATLLPPAAAGDRAAAALRVTVTVPPLVWLVSEVAGPEVVVEHLIEVGETPETFQPTDRRITALARSVLFFRVGVEAENGPWLRALADSGNLEVVDLRQDLALRTMEAHHHPGDNDHPSHRDTSAADAHGSGGSGPGMDPHIWLSPRRLVTMASTVAHHLAKVDPAGAAGYEDRATRLATRLTVLDAELRARLAPVEGRAFFVFHPAWGYFADDYGLEQVAIEIEGKVPTDRELTQLVRRARDLGVRTLFVQSQVRGDTPGILARAVGARIEVLDPLASDVPTNLRHAAERLLAALRPLEGDR